jgi:hypothetical protein
MNCHFLFDDFWMISECFLMVLHVVYAAMPLTKNHLPASCSGTAEPVNLEAAKTNSDISNSMNDWLVVDYPSEKYEFVSRDHYSQYMER